MNRFDAIVDKVTRKIARRSSRRRFLARLGSTWLLLRRCQYCRSSAATGRVPKPLKRGIHSAVIIGGTVPSTAICVVVVVVRSIHARLVVKFHPLVGLVLAKIL